MTANEVVGFYGSLFGLSGASKQKRVDYLLELVGLQNAGKKPLRAFSKGMLQRVGIAQALINDPKVLFFDEPTSGLDPVAHRDIRDLILHLEKRRPDDLSFVAPTFRRGTGLRPRFHSARRQNPQARPCG